MIKKAIYAILENFLSEDECDYLVMLHQQTWTQPGSFVHSKGTSPVLISDEDVCKCDILNLPLDHHINLKTWHLIEDFAEQYKFSINDMVGCQVMKYENSGKFVWHTDGYEPTDVLSMSIQLSHPQDYEGGDFQFGRHKNGNTQQNATEAYDNYEKNQDNISPIMTFPRDIGTVWIYNSFLYHRVTPITKGARYSMTNWFHGEKL